LLKLRADNFKLHNLKKKEKVLVVAHRGTCGANIIQNTIPAFINALKHNADILELDLVCSTDNVLYVFHDGNEYRVFGKKLEINNLSSKEIDELECINEFGVKSGFFLNRFEEVLSFFKGDVILNVDRAWFCWEETIKLIAKHNMHNQVILKSPVKKELLDYLESSETNIMYMPILYNLDDYKKVNDYNVNLIGLELIFDNLNHELLNPSLIAKAKKDEILLWANAIDLGTEFNLTAGFNDTKAIIDNPEKNWGKLIDLGFDVIQTDWPELLKEFIKNRKGKI